MDFSILSLSEFHVLPSVLVVALVGSGVLVVLAVTALFQRQSQPYILITLALVALLIRSFVGLFALYGYVPALPHHVFEHFMDAATVSLLVSAIYQARTAPNPSVNQA